MKIWMVGLIGLWLATPSTAQSAGVSEKALETDRAEVKLLKRQVDQQRQQIATLEAQVAAIRRHLRALGLEDDLPTGGPTSQPTTSPVKPSIGRADGTRPRRVVFVLANSSEDAVSEMVQAVAEMTSDQWFNVVFPRNSREATAYQAQLAQASEFNKKKLAEFFRGKVGRTGDMLPVLEAAMKWRPEQVWVLAPQWNGKPDEEASMRAVRQLNAVAKAKIHFVGYGYPSIEYWHLMWRIANETGGVCMNAKGEMLDEPVIPITPAPKPAPATKPSILREPASGRR